MGQVSEQLKLIGIYREDVKKARVWYNGRIIQANHLKAQAKEELTKTMQAARERYNAGVIKIRQGK